MSNNSNKVRDDAFESSEDRTWETFIELITSVVKMGIFFGCLYILKEIFMLLNDLFVCVEGQTLEVIHLEIIPVLVLVILSLFAFYLMKKD